jgi:hypothetical protein
LKIAQNSPKFVAKLAQNLPEIVGENDKLATLEYLNRSTNEDFGLFITPSFDGPILTLFDHNLACLVVFLSLISSKSVNV